VVLYDDFASTKQLGDFVAAAGTKVVVFSSNTGWTAVQAALGAGCAGYVFKGSSEERLVTALERVYAGERVVETGPDRADGTLAGVWPGREHGLTPRESEILALICQGLTNDTIAATLFLSVNSVKTYIRTLYRKIGVQRRSQAVLFGIGNGFLQPVTGAARPSAVHEAPAPMVVVQPSEQAAAHG
jgi:NarL family two-component system response regulator LiaR